MFHYVRRTLFKTKFVRGSFNLNNCPLKLNNLTNSLPISHAHPSHQAPAAGQLLPFQCSGSGFSRFLMRFTVYVHFSTLLHLPPLRFHCAGGSGIEPRTVATLPLIARLSKNSHSAQSHPQSARSHPLDEIH
jgi:hypothetical protein